jgi:WD40 repeat protein
MRQASNWGLAFSPDGSYLAAGCTNQIRLWTSH